MGELIKAVIYRVRNSETGEPGFELMEYDANANCELCGLRVGPASTGGTAVCAPCDVGRPRKGAKQRDRSRKFNPWANRVRSTYFPFDKEVEAYRRLLELDPEPIHKQLLKMAERRATKSVSSADSGQGPSTHSPAESTS